MTIGSKSCSTVPRGIRPFRCSTDSCFTERVAANLLDRDFVASRPNEVWVRIERLRRQTRAPWLLASCIIRPSGFRGEAHLRLQSWTNETASGSSLPHAPVAGSRRFLGKSSKRLRESLALEGATRSQIPRRFMTTADVVLDANVIVGYLDPAIPSTRERTSCRNPCAPTKASSSCSTSSPNLCTSSARNSSAKWRRSIAG